MINSPVEKIKERLGIEEVISSYIKLERSGANFKAKCPFHNEKTPSFFVSPDRSSYYCFGCGAKGDIFTFVEEFEGLDFKGALKILAERAGVKLGEYNQEKESEKEILYRVMEESTKFFENNLLGQTDVLEYLKLRGLTQKTIKDFRIGFVKDDWRLLYSYLKEKSFSDLEIEKAGLIKKTDKGFYDRFRGRIMFPISDSSGRVIAFSGRIFEQAPTKIGEPTVVGSKYLNSPDTPIFSKSAVLYGLDKAKDLIRKNNFSILVEGQMDLILSHQAGYRNTIASSGTALTDSTVSKEDVVNNLGLVRRLSNNIVLAFDADKAGFNAVNRAAKIALFLGMDVKIVGLPDDIDPADFILKSGSKAWRLAIKNSKHIIEFLLSKIIKNNKEDERKIGKEIKEKILPFVDAIESSIEKTYFIKKISDLSGISQNALQDDLKKIEQNSKEEKQEIKEKEDISKIFRKDYIERRLLGIIFWQRTLSKQTINVDKILKEITEIKGMKVDDFLEKMKDNKEDLIYEAEVFYGAGTDLEKDVKELILNFKEEYFKEELAHKMRELHIAEKNKDSVKSSLILKECQEINNKIQNIKNGRKN